MKIDIELLLRCRERILWSYGESKVEILLSVHAA
jgi:hypothetical protein